MRYRKKEIGCEVRYNELDLRALRYIKEFIGEENEKSDKNEEESQQHAPYPHTTFSS